MINAGGGIDFCKQCSFNSVAALRTDSAANQKHRPQWSTAAEPSSLLWWLDVFMLSEERMKMFPCNTNIYVAEDWWGVYIKMYICSIVLTNALSFDDITVRTELKCPALCGFVAMAFNVPLLPSIYISQRILPGKELRGGIIMINSKVQAKTRNNTWSRPGYVHDTVTMVMRPGQPLWLSAHDNSLRH